MVGPTFKLSPIEKHTFSGLRQQAEKLKVPTTFLLFVATIVLEYRHASSLPAYCICNARGVFFEIIIGRVKF